MSGVLSSISSCRNHHTPGEVPYSSCKETKSQGFFRLTAGLLQSQVSPTLGSRRIACNLWLPSAAKSAGSPDPVRSGGANSLPSKDKATTVVYTSRWDSLWGPTEAPTPPEPPESDALLAWFICAKAFRRHCERHGNLTVSRKHGKKLLRHPAKLGDGTTEFTIPTESYTIGSNLCVTAHRLVFLTRASLDVMIGIQQDVSTGINQKGADRCGGR